ncbi:hypothetical protein R3P38DRAFT_3235914 [Favolaschia claudopus]|uniref:Uncharacterized protein n=1 Tax=Favolaschia claudopus TaxID=2862362 RepID=A0AAV9ZDI1_9AGAR
MSAPPSPAASSDDDVDSLSILHRPTPIHSEPICRAWAEGSRTTSTRQMAEGRRRSALDDIDIRFHYKQHLDNCRFQHKHARGPQMTYSLRLAANKVLVRLHRLLHAPATSALKRTHAEAEADDCDEFLPQTRSPRPQKMLKFE